MTTTNSSYRPKLPSSTGVPSAETTSTAKTNSLYIRGNVISQTQGSATCELGKTKIICSIYGPRPRKTLGGRPEFSNRGALDVDAQYYPLSSNRMVTDDEREKKNRELSQFLENCLESTIQLEKFPKSVLDVYLTVLEEDEEVEGSSFACAVIVVSYALAKLGIEMFDLCSACSLAYSTTSKRVIVASNNGFNNGDVQGTCTIGFTANTKNMCCFDVRGENMDLEVLQQFVQKGQEVCLEIAKIMKQQLCVEEELEEQEQQNRI
jgi:exosome complex component MTR3